MNARETMAFKAMLKRIAAEENVPAQVVLQNYMFERLMARLVKLPLRKNLILKGGLAEKVETILVRGVLTTRPRDFYDVVLLTRHCPVDLSVFREALKATARHRGTEGVLADSGERMKTIASDKGLIEQWNRYVKTNSYVEGVTFADACAVLAKLLKSDLTDGEAGS